eukprot:scaffold647972_cov46-Prasinocladus_malaysianus.AAC.1
MIDTDAPFGSSPASLCKHEALKLALERPPWSPTVHCRFPPRFREAVKLLLRVVANPLAEDVSFEDPNLAEGDVGAMEQKIRRWSLPNDVLISIIGRMAYPISDWVRHGDWEPPEIILYSQASAEG